MKVAVLGATGPTGQAVVKQALEAGHEVVAMVRNPDKLQVKHDNLKVETCDIFSKDSMTPHFTGCDAVMSCLGARMTFFKPITLLQDSCKAIVPAMRQAGVKKFIPMSSQCAKDDANTPFMVKWIYKPVFIGRQLTDMAYMEDYLVKECQDVDFVVVKPPQLTNGPLESRTVLANEGQTGKGGVLISRANVAQFMLGQVQNEQWNKKLVSIAMQN